MTQSWEQIALWKKWPNRFVKCKTRMFSAADQWLAPKVQWARQEISEAQNRPKWEGVTHLFPVAPGSESSPLEEDSQTLQFSADQRRGTGQGGCNTTNLQNGIILQVCIAPKTLRTHQCHILHLSPYICDMQTARP